MDEKNYTGLIPENTEGRSITATSSTDLEDDAEAYAFYVTARSRLLDVNHWHSISGELSASFQVTDEHGEKVARQVKKGDHLRIDITGPGSVAGEGYDWAVVEDLKEVNGENVNSIALLVRPAANPHSGDKAVAHFFSPKSTSTFVVTREDRKVTASICDRNIEANEETEQVVDKFRNAVVGLGAKHGLSRIQWKVLAQALIKTDDWA